MGDCYHTIHRPSETELKVEASRFVAVTAFADSRDAAAAVLAAQRKRFHNATHHPYAFRLTPSGTVFRSADDGEPSGTAGKPILAAIDRLSLTNVVVVVTRYFGGTKLGVGGLARAYGVAAAQALDLAGRTECLVVHPLRISFPHGLVSQVMHGVGKTGAKIADTRYDEEVHMTLEVRASGLEELYATLVELTRGNIRRHPPLPGG